MSQYAFLASCLNNTRASTRDGSAAVIFWYLFPMQAPEVVGKVVCIVVNFLQQVLDQFAAMCAIEGELVVKKK